MTMQGCGGWEVKASGYKGKIKQSGSYGQFTDGWTDQNWSEHNQVIKLYLFCLSVRLSGYLSVSCLLLLPVTTHPVPCCCCLYSLFSPISLSLSHLLFCLYLPMVSSLSTLSLSLPLSGTADGDYGPVLPFVLGPQRDLWLFGQHTARLPISHTKCKRLSFH